MTLKQIQMIVGRGIDPLEKQLLTEADARAVELLRHNAGVIMSDAGDHHQSIAEIAAVVYGAEHLQQWDDVLTLWDDATARVWADPARAQGLESPSDAACHRWAPSIGAAYYFGLALGLRLAAVGAMETTKAAA